LGTCTFYANWNLQTVVLPAVIALALYLLLSFIVVPLWQRYHGRYSRYLPLETISAHTHGIRERIQDTIARFVLPSSWRQDFQQSQLNMSPGDESEHSMDDNDGEELYEFDGNRREALSLDARRVDVEDSGRLSRDLEEGFRDDSDDETGSRR
jgi:hypothetical protein